ncbi:TPA: Gfo/Idh/MocA family oxidoreductase [Candidatus Poribacteria bacterium]|nr:Gfo/Idh/MocA family oxidoreductase [Candidatus Poribacteria bacterium]
MIVRWGVIGAGGVANRRGMPAINIAEGNKLHALMVRDIERAKKLAIEHGAKAYYNSIEDLLSDDQIDAVHIATPVYLHCEHVILSAEHGKHILCEKPMAMNVNECQSMIDACKSNGVMLQVCFLLRFHSCFQEIKKLIDDGMLGEIVEARVALLKSYNIEEGVWRRDPEKSGGGVLMDMGAHAIDLISYLLGDVSEVCMFSSSKFKKWEVEDTATVMLKMKNCANAIADMSYAVPFSESTLEIYGTEGTIIAYSGKGYQEYKLKIYTKDIEKEESKPSENLYKNLFEHYSRCLNDEEEPLASGTSGLINIEIINSAYESAKVGKNIKIANYG